MSHSCSETVIYFIVRHVTLPQCDSDINDAVRHVTVREWYLSQLNVSLISPKGRPDTSKPLAATSVQIRKRTSLLCKKGFKIQRIAEQIKHDIILSSFTTGLDPVLIALSPLHLMP